MSGSVRVAIGRLGPPPRVPAGSALARRIRRALVVALVGCTSVGIAAPRPGAWQPFRTTGTNPVSGLQRDTRVRHLPYVVRGDQLWIDAQRYGPHENDAWVFDLATAAWSQHTSSAFQVIWYPPSNQRAPGAPIGLVIGL